MDYLGLGRYYWVLVVVGVFLESKVRPSFSWIGLCKF